MLKFKPEYQNKTLVLSDGTLVNSDNIQGEHVQKRLKETPLVSEFFESVKSEAKEPLKVARKKLNEQV
jgi:cell fate (sporulation/competence/biofilm development) regulator YmcA (YheA/YmcA/DUF963 family)